MIPFFNGVLPVLQSLLVLAALAGGVFVFRGSKKTNIVAIQNDTITAMQQQIDTLKASLAAMQKENDRYGYLLETIADALKQKGILITIQGEMITLEDTKSQIRSVRKLPKRPIATRPKKTETS